MTSKLMKQNGQYLRVGLGSNIIDLDECSLERATPVSEEEAKMFKSYFPNIEIVDVPPKWGIFYNKRVNVGYTEKQQLVKIYSTLVGSCIVFREADCGYQPLLFDTHDEAVAYGKLTRKFLGLNEEELLLVELQVV